MELSMTDKDTNDDNDVGEVVAHLPHIVTVILAIGGLIGAYFMTIGDFKLKDAELTQRVVYLEQKVNHIDETVESIKNKLEARVPVVDNDRSELRKELDDLKSVLQQMKPFLKK